MEKIDQEGGQGRDAVLISQSDDEFGTSSQIEAIRRGCSVPVAVENRRSSHEAEARFGFGLLNRVHIKG